MVWRWYDRALPPKEARDGPYPAPPAGDPGTDVARPRHRLPGVREGDMVGVREPADGQHPGRGNGLAAVRAVLPERGLPAARPSVPAGGRGPDRTAPARVRAGRGRPGRGPAVPAALQRARDPR